MLARALVISLSLAACSRQPSKPDAARSSPPRTLDAPRVRPPELQAALHLPTQPEGPKAPLLIMLHGLGSSAEDIESGSDWLSFATDHGIAWLAPSGPFDKHGRRFWDAGPSCCNFDRLPVDHVAALAELIESTLTKPGIDRARVFVGGHSNGAFMAHRLACERPDLVHGIIAIAGTGPFDAAACKPAGALRVLQIHGDADPIVPYAGGHLFQNPSLPEHLSAAKTISNWARLLGCQQTPKQVSPLDLESALPGPETRVQRYDGCTSGKLELWTVAGGGHSVGFRAPTPAAVWSFLNE
jgi:polyhydroxybutyrate depolymerase